MLPVEILLSPQN